MKKQSSQFRELKLLYLFLLSLVLYSPVHSQAPTQTVRGKVTAYSTQVPVQGASVYLPGTDPLKGTSTDSAGKFRIPAIPAGRYQLVASHVGYQTFRLSSLEITSGKVPQLEISLIKKTGHPGRSGDQSLPAIRKSAQNTQPC